MALWVRAARGTDSMSSRATSPSRVEYSTCRLSSHAHIVLIPEVVWVMIMPWYSGWHALRASKHPIMPFSLPQYTVVDAYDSKTGDAPTPHANFVMGQSNPGATARSNCPSGA